MTTTLVTVGVDLGAESREAVRWAARYSEAMGARLRAVTVWEVRARPVGPGQMMTPATDLIPPEDMQSSAADRLDEVLGESLDAEQTREVEKHVVPGDPATVLLERSADAEVLVLGNGHHGALGGALTGSVALHCLHHAECPVVLVPAPQGRG
ncbi:universal stress protein [Pseudonocardia sp. RS010]|uniref:universal stress protein n=1 Tax=Pseudonocardia sp. RS010 TaxID=3385979 RepID=UPI0039A277E7